MVSVGAMLLSPTPPWTRRKDVVTSEKKVPSWERSPRLWPPSGSGDVDLWHSGRSRV